MTTYQRPQSPPPGLMVGGYELRARLGEGGMGVVHLGQKPGERPVAIKVLRPHVIGDDEARRRLAREVSSLSRVRNRRIAEIVDADPWGDIPYVATRYVPGLSLHDHVQEEGPLEGADLLWFADCLAEALDAVHAVGVLHRDIKPSNVVMEGRTPILIDFGLARVADDSRITMNGWLLGTPGYLAPEILYGDDATAASDVHAWAATVAYAGTGRAPFGRGPSAAVMDRVRRGEHDLDGLDDQLYDLIEDALAVDAGDRPGLAEVREWLADLAGGGSPRSVRPAQPSAPVTLPYVASLRQEPALEDELFGDEDEDVYEDQFEDQYDTPAQATGWDAVYTRDPDHTWPQENAEWVSPIYGTERERAPLGQRLRRAVTILALGGVVSGAVAFAPWITLAVLAPIVWLLRSGSLAAAAVGTRRERRGAKWYDGVQLLLAAPWHLVAGLGGSIVLLLWSLGISAAVALLTFAAHLAMVPALGLIGAGFAIALWWGPGADRLRSPVHRAVDPVARRGVPWLLSTLLIAAAGTGLGAAASAQGTDWTPSQEPPLSDVRLPSWL